jgi:type I restriction enzyme S subunit
MSPDELAFAHPETERTDIPDFLPPGWAWARLGEIVTVRGEKLAPDPTSELPFIGMDDVPPGFLKATGHGFFRDMKSSANVSHPGDVLYGRLRPYLNKVALAEISAAASAEFIVFRPLDGIDARYVQLAMHARRFVNFATRDTSGDRPRIDFAKIAPFRIAVPPSREQRRIVARIDELFAEIDEGEVALERARRDLDTWRRALLKAAVTGELTRNWRDASHPNETAADFLDRVQKERTRLLPTARNRRLDGDRPFPSALLPDLPNGWSWAPSESSLAE